MKRRRDHHTKSRGKDFHQCRKPFRLGDQCRRRIHQIVVDNNDQKDYTIKSERLGEEEKEYAEMEVTNEDNELKITTNDGVLEVTDEKNEIIQDAKFEQPGFLTIGYLFIAVFIIAVILLGKILFDRKG